MGYNTAADFNEYAPSREVAVAWHFQSNCFPPVPTALVPSALDAIDAIEEGEYDRPISLPEDAGIFRADFLVDRLYLHAFITPDDDYR